MKNEVIVTAKTVDEAMAQARRQYGSSENELAFEILEMPKKGFLGFGATPAKVKVTITKALPDVDLSDLVSSIRNMKVATDRDGEEEKTPKQNKPQPRREEKKPNGGNNKPQNPNQNKKPQQKEQAKPQNTPAPKANFQPKQEKPAPAVKEEKPAVNENELPAALRRPVNKNQTKQNTNKKPQKKEKPAQAQRPGEEKKQDLLSAVMGIKAPQTPANVPQVTVTPVHVEKKAEKPAPEKKPAPAPEKKAEKPVREEKPHVEFVTPEEMEYALNFANTLLKNMDLSATAHAEEAPADMVVPEGMVYAKIVIDGDDTGILIGHHGDTLDAIQYLANLCASRNSGNGKKEFVKIVVDIENYRAKREETLRTLARRMCAKAVKYKRNFVLEPMNPYERRIIHSEVQGMENVSTHSVGSDENRKIVITYEGPDKVSNSRKSRDKKKSDKPRSQLPKLSREEIEAREKDLAEYRAERETAQKPVRAKSIDDIRIDLSEDSTRTFGSIGMDEGVEPDNDPIEKIAAEAESGEENLREF